MIELLALACSITEPSNCKDVRLSFAAESVTPQQCMMHGQMELAKWVEGHPNWRIAKWSCGQAGRFAKA